MVTIEAFLCNLPFLEDLITTFIGALLAIPAALWVDRYVRYKNESNERNQLIDALKNTIETNISLVGKLEEDLKKDAPTQIALNFMDLSLLDTTAVRKYELISSIPTCVAIDHVSYELHFLNYILDYIRIVDGNDPGKHKPPKDIIKSCRDRLRTAKDALNTAKEKLKELDRKR